MYKKYKQVVLLIVANTFACGLLNARITIPGIAEAAPAFSADTNKGILNFPQDYKGKWVILFSHPADFTPVCATEFKRLAKLIPELEEVNAYFVGLSVDSKYIHEIWVKELEAQMAKQDQDKEVKKKIDFPIVADLDQKVSKLYGMIHQAEDKKQTVRSIFIIDPKAKIRAIFFYPIANGRSFKEVKRILLALQETDKNNVATQADWQPGQKPISKEKRKAEYA